MSTLKTTNLQHPSAASPAIVLDADGDATYSGVHDFSAATVTGAPQGLVHIATETFSAVSSVSLNNVFTSDYDNYKIIIKHTNSASVYIQFRMRLSGTDATGSNYSYQEFSANGSGVGAVRYINIPQGTVSYDNQTVTGTSIEIYNPALAQQTLWIPWVLRYQSNSPILQSFAGTHSLATAYDGFTIYPNGGTTSGTLSVYGYKNGA